MADQFSFGGLRGGKTDDQFLEALKKLKPICPLDPSTRYITTRTAPGHPLWRVNTLNWEVGITVTITLMAVMRNACLTACSIAVELARSDDMA